MTWGCCAPQPQPVVGEWCGREPITLITFVRTQFKTLNPLFLFNSGVRGAGLLLRPSASACGGRVVWQGAHNSLFSYVHNPIRVSKPIAFVLLWCVRGGAAAAPLSLCLQWVVSVWQGCGLQDAVASAPVDSQKNVSRDLFPRQ